MSGIDYATNGNILVDGKGRPISTQYILTPNGKCLEHCEEIGIGTREYELIEVK